MTYNEYEDRKKEIHEKERKDVCNLAEEYINSLGLTGDVINTYSDNKKGVLRVEHDGSIHFYPYKNNGELSMQPRWFPLNVEKYIIPYTEGE